MENTHKEQVSSFLDNELGLNEMEALIKAIENDASLNKQFDRYALISDALNEDVVVHQESFLKSVQDALVVEPTVLAPRRQVQRSNRYVAAALAATVAIFTVVIFDVGSFSSVSSPLDSVAVIEAEQDEMLAREDSLNTDELDAQLVTFEK